MRRAAGPGLVLITILAVSGCSTPPPREYVNIAYHPGVEVAHYESWDFDRSRCVDSGVAGVPDARIRENLLQSIEEELEARGLPRRPGETAPDFRIWYEISIDSLDEVRQTGRVRGKLFVEDSATARTIWRGERKMSALQVGSEVESRERVRDFVRALLDQLAVLGPPFAGSGDRETGSDE